MNTMDIVRRLGLWVFVALVAAITVTALLSDLGRVSELIVRIPPLSLAAIVGAVLFNYALRFCKWLYYLRLLGLSVPLKDSLWTFFSAFTMVLSPGKLGEVMKSVLLKSRHGIPISRTAPIVLAERLTDLLGLFCLAAVGSSRFAFGGKPLAIAAVAIGSGILIMTRPGFWSFCDRQVFSRVPRLGALRGSLRVLEDSTGNLLSLGALAAMVPLSALSWAGEGVALFFIFQAIGVDQPHLLGISLFAHAFSSIVGALSFLPGGLFVTEGTLGVFFVYVGIGRDQAISATLLIRAVTLWFAVVLGTIVYLAGRQPGDLMLTPTKSGTSGEMPVVSP